MRAIPWGVLLGGMLCLGCGAAKMREAREADQAGRPAEAKDQQPAPAKKVKRMIIYTGNVEVIVDDFTQARDSLDELVKEHGGYLADWETSGTPGTPRSGTWTVRVPAERFRPFLERVQQLGELRYSKVDSEDVTDRYYDMEARIETDEKERQALLKLLEQTANNKLTDVLAVRDKLNEVEGRLDQQKGQRKRWKQLVDLATVRVTLRDRKDYVPPVVPDFGTRIGRTFQGSVEALLAFGKGVVIVAVAVAPWLGVLAVVGLPLAIWWRVHKRRSANRVAEESVSVEGLSVPSGDGGGPDRITEGEG